MLKKSVVFLLLILLILPTILIPINVNAASMTLAPIFKDNMVLQRGKPICIYGSGAGNGRVTLGDVTKQVTRTADGWEVYFDPMEASTSPIYFSYDLSGNTGKLKNVLVGDVYVASGQSNMAIQIYGTDHAISAAKDSPLLRYHSYGYWQPFTKTTVQEFSAVATLFAQELEEKLNKKIPIGIISASLGATGIQEWTSEDYCVCDKYHRDAHNRAYGEGRGPHKLYEKHIAPITNFSVAGVRWYQGESNTGAEEAKYYLEAFKNMVTNWRNAWKDQNLPFYTVQIMLFGSDNSVDENGNPRDEYNIRIAQGEAARTMKNVTMCSLLSYEDTVLANGNLNIHPTNKTPVAKALANAALTTYYKPLGEYGKSPEYSGPLYKEVKANGNTAEITFSHAAGLKLTDGEVVRELEVRTGGGRWIAVDGKLEGNKVVVLDSVSKLTGVRLGYRNRPTLNLYNGAGYCASPFLWEDKNAKIEHLPLNAWAYDSKSHWHRCDVEDCEEKFAVEAHSGGKADDCKTKAVCDICNRKYGEFGPHKNTTTVNQTETYTGDIVCTECRAVVERGKSIEKANGLTLILIIAAAVILSGGATVFIILKKQKAKRKQEPEN